MPAQPAAGAPAGAPAAPGPEDMAALQADFARIVNEQAVIKANLQLILTRLSAAAQNKAITPTESVTLSA